MFAVTVTFNLHPDQFEAFLPLMIENARASLRDEPGCHQFDVCHGGAADTVFLYELYTDAAAFETHLGSAHFKDFSQRTEQMIASKEVKTYAKVLQ